MSLDNDEKLKIFSRIVNFVNQLNNVFGKRQHSLQLYNRLITNIKISSTLGIDKHIDIFKDFTLKNRECIVSKCPSKLVENNIKYSDNINIKMKEIFRMSDIDTTKIIFDHLIVINALLNSTTENKEILKDSLKSTSSSNNAEKNCIDEIISNLENVIDPQNSNSAAEILKLTTNPNFTNMMKNMIGGITSGDLDPAKLFTTAVNMSKDLSNSTSTSVTVTEKVDNKCVAQTQIELVKEDKD